MVVDEELKNPMRSHHDLEKDNARYVRKAIKVFNCVTCTCIKVHLFSQHCFQDLPVPLR